MDAAKKAALERQIVMGLVGLFAVTFAVGPLKSLGLFRAGASKAAPVRQAAGPENPLGAAMQGHWKQLEEAESGEPKTQEAASAREVPPAPAAYTAHTLRDPLKSLLPERPQPVKGEPGMAGATTGVRPPVQTAELPPPDLHVEGLIWGGPRPTAIIDGEVYGVNDVVKGAKILGIDRRGVTVECGGKSVLYPPVSISDKAGNPASRRTASQRAQ